MEEKELERRSRASVYENEGEMPPDQNSAIGVHRNSLGGHSAWASASAPRIGGIGLNQDEREGIQRKQLYVHVTHATDQKNIEFTFVTCQDIILRANIESLMM